VPQKCAIGLLYCNFHVCLHEPLLIILLIMFGRRRDDDSIVLSVQRKHSVNKLASV